jgi:hypothetical protein
MFDSGGKPGEKWKASAPALEYEADLERAKMCDLRPGLFRPSAWRRWKREERRVDQMTMHRVAKNLENLTPPAEEPHAQGCLARITLHLLSLENFARL